jgi:hypothetical protein
LEASDLKKNFLRIEMNYETGQRFYETFELRRFKTFTGNSIFVFSDYSSVPHQISQNKLAVFSYDKKDDRLNKIGTLGLPVTATIKDFLKYNTPDSIIKKYEIYSSINYELGYEGENISLIFEGSFSFNKSDEDWLLGNTIEFIWAGDHFIRHTPVFKN